MPDIYYKVCYTCSRWSLTWVLRKVLRRLGTWAKAGACLANIVVRWAPNLIQTFRMISLLLRVECICNIQIQWYMQYALCCQYISLKYWYHQHAPTSAEGILIIPIHMYYPACTYPAYIGSLRFSCKPADPVRWRSGILHPEGPDVLEVSEGTIEHRKIRMSSESCCSCGPCSIKKPVFAQPCCQQDSPGRLSCSSVPNASGLCSQKMPIIIPSCCQQDSSGKLSCSSVVPTASIATQDKSNVRLKSVPPVNFRCSRARRTFKHYIAVCERAGNPR